MALIDDIDDRRKAALKAGNKFEYGKLTTFMSEANSDVRRKANRPANDSEVYAKAKSIVGNLELAVTEGKKHGRAVGEFEAELVLLREYLPPAVDLDSVRALVEGLGLPAAPASLGAAMKAVKFEYGDSFDGNTMTPVVRAALGI
jgi:uncharacterized protein YqeY